MPIQYGVVSAGDSLTVIHVFTSFLRYILHKDKYLTEMCIESPEHALVAALTLISEGTPVAEDSRIISWELLGV